MLSIYRDFYIYQLKNKSFAKNTKKILKLAGWVNSLRIHPKVIFLDLKDSTGTVQCVIKEELNLEKAKSLKTQDVICIEGWVLQRDQKFNNPEKEMGDLEVYILSFSVLSKANLPISVEQDWHEHNRLKYRYLDLRNETSFRCLKFRSALTYKTHLFFKEHGFTYVDTPILTPSTPEGARDFLVFSRHYPGHAYALPQSPQLFKQILISSGIDKYYQLARCFRDEDLRANRQPEFSQIDLEMSFATETQVMSLVNEFILSIINDDEIMKETPYRGQRIKKIPTIKYAKAMSSYGCDAPDLSIQGLEIKKIKGMYTLCLYTEKAFDPKTYLDVLTSAGNKNSKILNQHPENKYEAEILKFYKENIKSSEGCYIIISKSLQGMSKLRTKLAKDFNLFKKGLFPVWVVEFPMFEKDENNKLSVLHHPFTLYAKNENILKSKASAYDLVINGQEIGGGSVRQHNPEKVKEVFSHLGYSDEMINKQFEFFLNALGSGTPPHAGIALGLERLIMVLNNEENIRNVIAFPKSQSSQCFLTHSPLEIEKKTMLELHLRKVKLKKNIKS